MTIEEIKAIMNAEVVEGEVDDRLDKVYAEIEERDYKLKEKDDQIVELTAKVADLADTNAKLAEKIAYVEPEKVEEVDDETEEIEFADLENLYEED